LEICGFGRWGPWKGGFSAHCSFNVISSPRESEIILAFLSNNQVQTISTTTTTTMMIMIMTTMMMIVLVVVVVDISYTLNRQFFQGLGQLESTVAGTRYISIRPRHRTNAHYATEFHGTQQ